jgi:hypothetical protein
MWDNVRCDAARKKKASLSFPRPAAGALRPIVHGQTVKYNLKKRLGRGFTFEELKVRSHFWKSLSLSLSLSLSVCVCVCVCLSPLSLSLSCLVGPLHNPLSVSLRLWVSLPPSLCLSPFWWFLCTTERSWRLQHRLSNIASAHGGPFPQEFLARCFRQSKVMLRTSHSCHCMTVSLLIGIVFCPQSIPVERHRLSPASCAFPQLGRHSTITYFKSKECVAIAQHGLT